jgi:hypothetical protein
MSTYHWVFLQTGRVKKKLTFILCSPNGTKYIEKDRITDLNVAYQYEYGAINNGHKFTNSIDDFLNNKIMRMDQKTFNAFMRGK